MSPEAVAPPHPEKAVPQRTFRLPREIGILGALGLMLLVLAVFIPQFRDIQNITNITRNFSFVGIVAMGTGPTTADAAQQVQVLQDLVSEGVDGIAVAQWTRIP